MDNYKRHVAWIVGLSKIISMEVQSKWAIFQEVNFFIESSKHDSVELIAF